jgi:hypothetical protein
LDKQVTKMKNPSSATTIKYLTGSLIFGAIVVGIFALARFDATGKKGSGLGSEFAYDIEDLSHIDPNLIVCEQVGVSINTGFANSRGIAVGTDGSIYVAGDKAIRVFAENGTLLNELELEDSPGCLAIANSGKIYIGMKDHVEVLDAKGKRLTSWQTLGDKAVLTSIAVLKNDVFVADAGNRIVLRYDTAGSLIRQIGRKDESRNIPGFVIPSPYFDLAVGPDGLLRVTDPGRHRIEAYTFNGDLEFWWGEFSADIEGFCGCCNPVNFAMLPDGSFVTCEKGLVRVKIYDAEGGFGGVVAGPEQLSLDSMTIICETPAECESGGFDVAVDKTGRILVLDTINNVVRTFVRVKPKL